MKRPLLAALATLLLTAGCSAPPEELPQPGPGPAPPPVERPAPQAPLHQPPGAPAVERVEGGQLVRAVRESYLWFAGGQRLAVLNDAGLWAIGPAGEPVELIAPAGPIRTLAGAFQDLLIYLEQREGAVLVMAARPGQPPRQLAAVEHPGVEAPSYPLWAAVTGSRLALAIEGRRPVAVDLLTGRLHELGDEAVPVWKGELALSPDRRFLAYKQINRGDGLRLLDLETGTVIRPAGEAHLPGIAWSATGRWAVRAAEPDSGLPAPVGANLEEGATHLDLGDPQGALTHLVPPTDLVLEAGPWWSPDGSLLAVTTAHRGLWVVEPATGRWRRLGTLGPGSFVTGFHPGGGAVMVYSEKGLSLWPLSDEPPVRVEPPWRAEPNSPLLLPDGSLLYLSPEPEPTLYLQRPGAGPAPLTHQSRPLGRLTVEGERAALIRYGPAVAHDLLLLPLPR
ncbi:MAG: WD40 repeat domain-containing protein [Bacillota bacterium]